MFQLKTLLVENVFGVVKKVSFSDFQSEMTAIDALLDEAEGELTPEIKKFLSSVEGEFQERVTRLHKVIAEADTMACVAQQTMNHLHKRFASFRQISVRPSERKRHAPSSIARPNPAEHTTAKCWTLKDGSLCLSTKTEWKSDGKVIFAPLESGTPTLQIQFMRLLCFKYPEAITLKEIIKEVYPEDLKKVLAAEIKITSTLKKLRGLVSDIRTKKLAPAGINPDILPPLNQETTLDYDYSLQLAKLHRMDDKAVDDFDDQDFR